MEETAFSAIEDQEENKNTRAAELVAWEEIFDKLDTKDGVEDQRIDKAVFLEWIDTLSFQASVSLEAKHGIDRGYIRYILEKADRDKDGYIDKAEFLKLVEDYSRGLEEIQRSKFLTYIRIAAYSREIRWWPPPLFILITSLIQILIYVFCAYGPKTEASAVTTWLIYDPARRHEVWRWFTYSFLHGDDLHITLNLILQLLVGLSLEMSNNWWRVGIVYISGVVCGALLFSMTSPRVLLLGASAGVTAIVTAHIASIILNWKEDSLIIRQRFRERKASSPLFGNIVRIGRIALVTGILSVDIINVVVNNPEDKVAYGAHGGGAMAGLFIGLIVLENRRVHHYEVRIKGMSIGFAIVMIITAVAYNIVMTFYGGIYPDTQLGLQKSAKFLPGK